ncbi:MAG: hypothetical protein H6R00_177 [Proteobacteria bacterium]|nr:hypothetical protein [Pseudomonadota bacterium]
MSVVRIASRLVIVLALRGHTLAGGTVADSENTPFDKKAAEAVCPFISVYTDNQARNARDIDPARPVDRLTITIEIGVSAKVQDDKGEDIDGLPMTDAGMELILDAIERQILIVLADDENPWSAIWKRLWRGDPQLKSTRGASAADGVRFAGRQLEIIVEPLKEPPSGAPATGVWADLLSMVDVVPGRETTARMLRQLIEAPAPTDDWYALRRNMLMSAAEGSALLLDPMPGVLPEFGEVSPT